MPTHTRRRGISSAARFGAAGGVLLFAGFLALQGIGRRWMAAPGATSGPTAAVALPPGAPDPLAPAPVTGLLDGRALAFPVPAVPAGATSDSFVEARSGHLHGALDILAPRGSPVVAVDDGSVARIAKSAAGGLAVYQLDAPRHYCFFYAHLDGYAPGLVEGAPVQRGQVLGYVGTSGNAPPTTPHLHFAVFALRGTSECARGRPVNPYPLWR